MLKNAKALTLIELILVVVIIGILACLAIAVPRGQLEKARANEAKTNLKLLWAAEKDYYIHEGEYTEDWNKLEIDNPNSPQAYFDYTITVEPLRIYATCKRAQSSTFSIDADGHIDEIPYGHIQRFFSIFR